MTPNFAENACGQWAFNRDNCAVFTGFNQAQRSRRAYQKFVFIQPSADMAVGMNKVVPP
jgi:hypothetical protein